MKIGRVDPVGRQGQNGRLVPPAMTDSKKPITVAMDRPAETGMTVVNARAGPAAKTDSKKPIIAETDHPVETGMIVVNARAGPAATIDSKNPIIAATDHPVETGITVANARAGPAATTDSKNPIIAETDHPAQIATTGLIDPVRPVGRARRIELAGQTAPYDRITGIQNSAVTVHFVETGMKDPAALTGELRIHAKSAPMANAKTIGKDLNVSTGEIPNPAAMIPTNLL